MTNGMTKEDIYIMKAERYNTTQASLSVALTMDKAFGRGTRLKGSMKENFIHTNHTGMEFLQREAEANTKETGITAKNMVKGNSLIHKEKLKKKENGSRTTL